MIRYNEYWGDWGVYVCGRYRATFRYYIDASDFLDMIYWGV